MQRFIVSLIVLVASSATPVLAKDGPKGGKLQLDNSTTFGISVTITQGRLTIVNAKSLEPKESIRVGIAAVKKDEDATADVVIHAKGLEYPFDALQTTETISGPSLPKDGDCRRYKVVYEDEPYPGSLSIEEAASPCDAAIIRESRVLACSSLGLLALSCVGYRLGRAPRRRGH